jgi:hypothetical protein
MQKWLFGLAGMAIGVAAGIGVAAAIDSPMRARQQAESELVDRATRAERELGRLADRAATLEERLCDRDLEAMADRERVAAAEADASSLAQGSIALAGELLRKRALGLSLAQVVDGMGPYCELDFVSQGEGLATHWTADCFFQGRRRGTFFAVGPKENLLSVGFRMWQIDDAEFDFDNRMLAAELLRFVFGKWDKQRAHRWIHDAAKHVADDREIGCREGPVFADLAREPRGRALTISFVRR